MSKWRIENGVLMEPIPQGWLAWDGGESCPVNPEHEISVIFRNGTGDRDLGKNFVWSEVIAYNREVEPDVYKDTGSAEDAIKALRNLVDTYCGPSDQNALTLIEQRIAELREALFIIAYTDAPVDMGIHDDVLINHAITRNQRLENPWVSGDKPPPLNSPMTSPPEPQAESDVVIGWWEETDNMGEVSFYQDGHWCDPDGDTLRPPTLWMLRPPIPTPEDEG